MHTDPNRPPDELRLAHIMEWDRGVASFALIRGDRIIARYRTTAEARKAYEHARKETP